MVPTRDGPASCKESEQKQRTLSASVAKNVPKVPTDSYPPGTHLKISQCLSFSCDPGAFPAAASALEFVGSPLDLSLGFLQPSVSPGYKPCWFPESDEGRGCSSSRCRCPGWGTQCGAWTPHFSGDSCGCDIPSTGEWLRGGRRFWLDPVSAPPPGSRYPFFISSGQKTCSVGFVLRCNCVLICSLALACPGRV